jgi:hypothetical protein
MNRAAYHTKGLLQHSMMEKTSASKAKTELACDVCRLLKVKCIRERADPPTCQKCSRSGAHCTWQIRQPRTRKYLPRSAARINALEAKVDQLLTVIDATASPPTHDRETSKYHGIQTPATVESQYIPDDNALLKTLAIRFQLSVGTAELQLQHFRNMTLYFPFVVIPDSMDIQKLSVQNPMLSLAVLTVSATQNRKLQAGLEEMLRRELVEKIMLRGEKGLGLLAALLVYLGWTHFFHVPKKDSFQQFLGLAITICDELGLNLRPAEAASRQMKLRVHRNDCSLETAQRLYLGIYFLDIW